MKLKRTQPVMRVKNQKVLSKEVSLKKKFKKIGAMIWTVSLLGFGLEVMAVDQIINSFEDYTVEDSIRIEERLESETEALMTIIGNYPNIKNVNMLFLGNSYGAGFSHSEETVSLVNHLKDLINLCKEKNVDLSAYSWGLPEENSNDEILKLLYGNVTINEINEEVIYQIVRTAPGVNKTKIELQKDYPTNLEDNPGITDLLSNQDEDTLTIVFAFTSTGKVLDRITRGDLGQKLTFSKGAEEDINDLDSILKFIKEKNNKVFVCVVGVPTTNTKPLTLLNPIIEDYNNSIKTVTEKYSNSWYVNSNITKMVYKKEDKYIIEPHNALIENKELVSICLNNVSQNLDQHLVMATLEDSFNNHFMGNRDNKEMLNNKETLTQTLSEPLEFFLRNSDIPKENIVKGLEEFIKTLDRDHTYVWTWNDIGKTEEVAIEIIDVIENNVNTNKR